MSEQKQRKKITIEDIAKKFNISRNAVSLALNNKPGVSDTLRKAIKQSAKEMNYRCGIRKNRKRNNILIIIKDYLMSDKWFYPSMYKGIEQSAISMGFNSILSSVTPEMDTRNILPPIFEDIVFSGIIAIGIFSESFLIMLKDTGLPVVLSDTYDYLYRFPAVVTDNIHGTFKMVEYLVSCGHKKIGFLGPYGRISTSFFDRWRGYVSAMQYFNLQIKAEYCIFEDFFPVSSTKADLERIDRIIEGMSCHGPNPSAWVFANDMHAIKVIKFLSGKGVNIPDDISIAGFDNIPEGELITPSLTTMNVRKYSIGVKTFELLFSILNSSGPPENDIIITIQSDLIIRNSVAKIG